MRRLGLVSLLLLIAVPLQAQQPDGFGGALGPAFLLWLAGPGGTVGCQDAVLVGHSLGGFTSLRFYFRHPERVRALVLVGSGPGFRDPQAREKWNGMAERFAVRLESDGLGILQKASLEVSEAKHRSAQSLALAARHMLAQHDSRVIDAIGEIDVPTLVMIGSEDKPFIGSSQYMAKKIPGARLVAIEGGGHAVNIEQARAFSPTLNALLNNAAVQIAKPLLETTVDEWDCVMENNLRSVFLSVKLAHPLFRAAGGGAIVNVSSAPAVATSANIAAYAASKGGLLALTRAMAIEFAPDNIRVNAILPGAVDTPMLRAGLGRGHVGQGDMQERLDNLARKTVSGKVGTPEEIARAIYFLADNEQSSFMTGQALVVDGGATARLSTE